MKKLFIVFFLIISCVFIIAANDLVIGPKIRKQISSHFTAQQIEQLDNQLKSIRNEGLPINALLSRILEASSKKVKFNQLKKVLNNKIKYLRKAVDAINSCNVNKVNRENISKNLEVIGEFFERGLTKTALMDMALNCEDTKGIIDSNFIEHVRIWVILKEKGIYNYYGIAMMLIEYDFEKAKSIFNLILKYPSYKAWRTVNVGKKMNENIEWHENELIEHHRKAAVQEILKDKRPER